MPRISELEQRPEDTLEVAISPNDFTRLGSANDPHELRATLLNGNGTEYGSFLLSTNQADWAQDPITLEYLLIHPIVGFGSHRTDWDGIVLNSTNATGLDAVFHLTRPLTAMVLCLKLSFRQRISLRVRRLL